MSETIFNVNSSIDKTYEVRVITNEYPDDKIYIVAKYSVSLSDKDRVSLIIEKMRDKDIFNALKHIKIYEPMDVAKYIQFLP